VANPEHVEIVKQGPETIAAWRKAHPHESLVLSNAKLTGASLSNAKLYAANLSGANLSGADLSDAHFSGADLSDAYLTGADLSDADLSNADLSGAYMFGANLSHAELSGADISGAILLGTVFADVDLSAVRGLDEVEHYGESTVGVDTLFRSKGKIPRSFLKGCGVPDVLIDCLPTLIGAMEPIQLDSCFLSHSSKDEEFTKRLHGRMEQEKLRVWYAPEDMRGGRKSEWQIDEAIRVYDRLLLVLSEHSMNSEWVRREIKSARNKEEEPGREVLFPISLVPFEQIRAWKCFDADTGEDLAEKVREYHIPNFTDWKNHDAFEKAFADLMRDLRREDEERAKAIEGP
jgi:hypothetical protein